MKIDTFTMRLPTKILFGNGQLNNLHKQSLPGKKAMIVTSSGQSSRRLGYLAKTETQLKLARVDTVVFEKVQPNPLKSAVMEGSAFARENGCDFIVALGGGSVLDTSKGIAIMAVNEGDYWDYIPSGTGKNKIIKNKPLPIVSIPTTAGTGSEINAAMVITNETTNEKTGNVNQDLYPTLAVIDPTLTLSTPSKLTAFQGFDALSHSMEAYVSNGASLFSDTLALAAIENISGSLPKAVKKGTSLSARDKVAFGNFLSGVVESIGRITSLHSLEHAMSAYHPELPHGAGLIILSKAYFSLLIEKHVCDKRFINMARALGMKNAKKPDDFITALTGLMADCRVANIKMSEYGITPAEFKKMAKNARFTMGRLFNYDRIKISERDCIAIYQDSYL